MLLIFDWDGTLSNSAGGIVAAMQQAAQHFGAPEPTETAVRNVIGLGLPEAMEIVFPQQSREEQDERRELYSRCYVELDREPSGLFPGAMETMESLRSAGHSLAVATGKGRRGLNRVLAGLGLGDFFDATRCADETASKPDPKMIFELLEELDFQAVNSLVIGDSIYDLEMAARAGVASVGVSYGVHSAEQLHLHGPLAVIDAMDQLPGYVAN